jgi:hypothetical protein
VVIVVAAMDLLFRPICEFEHKVLECHGASFDDFLLYFGSPNVLDPPLSEISIDLTALSGSLQS